MINVGFQYFFDLVIHQKMREDSLCFFEQNHIDHPQSKTDLFPLMLFYSSSKGSLRLSLGLNLNLSCVPQYIVLLVGECNYRSNKSTKQIPLLAHDLSCQFVGTQCVLMTMSCCFCSKVMPARRGKGRYTMNVLAMMCIVSAL